MHVLRAVEHEVASVAEALLANQQKISLVERKRALRARHEQTRNVASQHRELIATEPCVCVEEARSHFGVLAELVRSSVLTKIRHVFALRPARAIAEPFESALRPVV